MDWEILLVEAVVDCAVLVVEESDEAAAVNWEAMLVVGLLCAVVERKEVRVDCMVGAIVTEQQQQATFEKDAPEAESKPQLTLLQT